METKRRTTKLPAALLPAILCLPMGAAEAEPPKVERLEIVDRAIEHHGGRLFDHVQVSLTISSRSGSFRVVQRQQGGLFDHRVVRESEGVRLEHHQTNDSIRVWRDGEPVVLDDTEAQRARDYVSARVYFNLLPYRLNDSSAYKQDLGVETWEGRQLHKVKVSFEPGTSTSASSEFLYWFDPRTARMVQFAYSFSGGLRLRKLIDYRRIGGLLFADSENYAIDDAGLKVDLVTPEYVAASMPLLSTVHFTDIEVERLD